MAGGASFASCSSSTASSSRLFPGIFKILTAKSANQKCARLCVQLRACVLSHAHLMPSHAHLHLQPRFPSIELVRSAGRAVRPFGITRGAENNESILGSKKLKTLAPLALQAGSHHRCFPESHSAIASKTSATISCARVMSLASAGVSAEGWLSLRPQWGIENMGPSRCEEVKQ